MTSLGTLETRDDGKVVIRFERRYDHPIERVWAALTQPDQMIGWWGKGTVDLREGGEFKVVWLNEHEGERASMNARITALDPPRLLETKGDMHGNLRWELEPDGDGTRLRFSSTLDLPEDQRTSVIAGWHTHLDALDAVLSGGSVDLVNIETLWEPIHERYVEALARS